MDGFSYESDELLHQYLLFHYGEAEDQIPWEFGPQNGLEFPGRCVREGVDPDRLPARGRALDIGCAVGRSTFELAKIFDGVTGIDYSDAFIMAARLIAREGAASYLIKETGTISREAVARRPADLTGQVHFEQGDAQNLPPSLGSFDGVLAAAGQLRRNRALHR